MPQRKAVYPSQQLLKKIMLVYVSKSINQSLLLVLKMEIIHTMSTNELAMPQYKPSEMIMLQDKLKSITDERAMAQNKSSF